jgi:hypothetical protein
MSEETLPGNGLAQSTGVTNPLVLIERMIEKGVDPTALRQMMDLSERWETNQAAKRFAERITMFQSKCEAVYKGRAAQFDEKDGSGNKTGNKVAAYKFASYDDIMAEVQPILAECEIVVTFSTDEPKEGRPGLSGKCRVRVGQHTEDSYLFLPIPEMKVNATQKFGAALSYLKRYLLCAALNIRTTDVDDDAGTQFDTITAKQQATLDGYRQQIEDVQAKATGQGVVFDNPFSMARFWQWAKCKTFAELPAEKYGEAAKLLNEKKCRLEEEVAAKGGAK